MPPPVRVDWATVKLKYETGRLTPKEIAEEHAINRVTLYRKAREEKWYRDPRLDVRKRTLIRLLNPTPLAVEVTESELEAAADENVKVIRGHRKDIKKAQGLTGKLFAELEMVGVHKDLLLVALNAVKSHEPKDRPLAPNLVDGLQKIANLPTRAVVAKDLSLTLKTLIALERQAYSISDGPEGGGTIEEYLSQLGSP